MTLAALSRTLRLSDDHLQRVAFGDDGVALIGPLAVSERFEALESEVAALKARAADFARNLMRSTI
ncbi:hypothetical protein [Actinocorallia sp. A-T 12471]|uniref:hypothetical protein n=1 Tax=Actinocorallia sp. A-T 12471 TaxID=3089813 RepID=UPI0029CC9DC1|nr:hypothetical protein [Actinocorallia sp. A-T 12471]MDX6744713.1 hypothetical protein [Actinocorallia sp. A-T 12471]